MRARVVLSAALAAWSLILPGPAISAEVIIGPRDLQPQTVSAVVGERVTFVNRSGALVHVEFHAEPRGHRVYQVPGQIWATFHAPGRHGYTIHLPRPEMELHGVVVVTDVGHDIGRSLRECSGISVEGECIDRE